VNFDLVERTLWWSYGIYIYETK